jgi:hypothetical protein
MERMTPIKTPEMTPAKGKPEKAQKPGETPVDFTDLLLLLFASVGTQPAAVQGKPGETGNSGKPDNEGTISSDIKTEESSVPNMPSPSGNGSMPSTPKADKDAVKPDVTVLPADLSAEGTTSGTQTILGSRDFLPHLTVVEPALNNFTAGLAVSLPLVSPGDAGAVSGTVPPSPAAPIEPPPVMEQVGGPLVSFLRLGKQGGDGEQVVKIQLQPESLGRVDVKISLNDNQISTHIVTDTHMVRDLIDANQTSLRTALQEQGLQVGDMWVSVRQQSPDGDRYRSPSGRENRGGREMNGVPLLKGLPDSHGYLSAASLGLINVFA